MYTGIHNIYIYIYIYVRGLGDPSTLVALNQKSIPWPQGLSTNPDNLSSDK